MSKTYLTHEARAAIKRERLDTLTSIFERANRTITARPIRVRTTTESRESPAWSDGTNITFNASKLGELTSVEEIISLNGLNFHELCHVLYTPRNTYLRNIRNAGEFFAFNLLEDQRIESLFIARFPGVKPYLNMTIMQHIVKADNGNRIFPLVWGRKYLGQEFRDAAASLYVDQSSVDAMKMIIDEFRGLVLPRDMARAEELTADMHALMEDNVDEDDSPTGHTQSESAQIAGSTESVAKQSKAQAAREEEDAEQEEEDAAEDEGESGEGEDIDDEGEDEGESGEGEGEGEGEDGEDGESEDGQGGKADGGAGEDGEGEDESGDGGDDDESGNANSSGTPEGGEDSKGTQTRDLKDIIESKLDEIKGNAEVQADAQAKQKAILSDTNTVVRHQSAGHHTLDVPAIYRTIASKVAKQFERIVKDMDPGFKTHRDSGKINVQRAMRGEAADTVFDQWDEGQNEATDIEFVGLLDMSGSMCDDIVDASLAVWTIMRSLRSLGSTTNAQAMGFDTSSWKLYGLDDAVEPSKYRQFSASALTDPLAVLKTSESIMRRSRKAHKIVMYVTDGIWSSHVRMECEAIIARMRANGVMVAEVFYDRGGSVKTMKDAVESGEAAKLGRESYYRQHLDAYQHGADVAVIVQTPSDLIKFASDIVKVAMRSK